MTKGESMTIEVTLTMVVNGKKGLALRLEELKVALISATIDKMRPTHIAAEAKVTNLKEIDPNA